MPGPSYSSSKSSRIIADALTPPTPPPAAAPPPTELSPPPPAAIARFRRFSSFLSPAPSLYTLTHPARALHSGRGGVHQRTKTVEARKRNVRLPPPKRAQRVVTDALLAPCSSVRPVIFGCAPTPCSECETHKVFASTHKVFASVNSRPPTKVSDPYTLGCTDRDTLCSLFTTVEDTKRPNNGHPIRSGGSVERDGARGSARPSPMALDPVNSGKGNPRRSCARWQRRRRSLVARVRRALGHFLRAIDEEVLPERAIESGGEEWPWNQ